MSAPSDRTAWLLAGMLSCGLHAGGLAALLLLSSETASKPAETTIAVLALPAPATSAAPVDVARLAASEAAARQAPALTEHARLSAEESGRTVAAALSDATRATQVDEALLAEPTQASTMPPRAQPERLASLDADATRRADTAPDRPAAVSAAELAAVAGQASRLAAASQPMGSAQAIPAARLDVPAPSAERVPEVAAGTAATVTSPTDRQSPAATAATTPERVPASSAMQAATVPVERQRAPAATTAPDITVATTARVAAADAQTGPPTALGATAPERVASTPAARPGGITGGAASPALATPAAPERAVPVGVQPPAQDAGEESVAALVPTQPAFQTAPRATETYRGVLDFLRRYESGGCFVVLPSARLGGLVGLDGFAAEGAQLSRFVDDFRRSTGVLAETNLDAISNAQCRAASFARSLPGYPAFSLYFEIRNRQLNSGELLSGTIRNVNDRPLHLLLIDDEGTVQSVDGFVTSTGAHASFGAHMTLTGGPVATVQLLVALAGEARLDTVTRMNGEKADAFFADLSEEIAARGITPDIAIASFSVR